MAGGCKVLVVDDDPDSRGSVAAVLEAEGYSVAEAEDGLDALKQLRASTCTCLVVLDLFMPTMNGWTFRQEQMRDPALASIPVVIVSADSSAARQAVSLGVEAAMAKPLDFDRFLAVVGRYC
jgi:CheY-like chemotaxis protein